MNLNNHFINKHLITFSNKFKAFTKLLLGREEFTFRKLLKFVKENLPESFWSETEDDAKPDYLFGIIDSGPDGRGRERIVHSDKALNDLEKIEKGKLKKTGYTG